MVARHPCWQVLNVNVPNSDPDKGPGPSSFAITCPGIINYVGRYCPLVLPYSLSWCTVVCWSCWLLFSKGFRSKALLAGGRTVALSPCSSRLTVWGSTRDMQATPWFRRPPAPTSSTCLASPRTPTSQAVTVWLVRAPRLERCPIIGVGRL